MTYIPKTLNLIRNNIITNIVSNVDEINDTNVGSGLDIFTTSIAYEIQQQYDDMKIIYDGFHIDTATDYDLDQLGALIGVSRNEGVSSSGVITFIKNVAPTTAFTIPSGIVVSTQPDTNSTVYNFTTTEEKEFPISATDNKIFIDGIYDYRLTHRIYKDLEIEISSVPFTNFTIDESFSGNIIDTSTVESLSTCEASTGWTALTGAAALTVNSTYKIQGNNSLNLIKTSTATDNFGYLYSIGSNKDLNGLTLCFSIRTTDIFLTNKFSKMEIVLGSGYDSGTGSDNNKYTWVINDITKFIDGEFVRFFLDISDATVSNAPVITEIDFLEIFLYTQNLTDTVSANEFVMDFWFASEYETYSGYSVTIDKTTKPTSGVTMDFSYIPLSVDVSAISNNIGVDYNVASDKITYLSSIVSNIDRVYNYSSFTGGKDTELDTDYRERITSGAYAQATSSAIAIEENLKKLDYVKDALVIDMPEKTVESEAQIYNDSTKLTNLDKYIAKDTSTLLVSDTYGGAANYTKNIDYEINNNNQLDWSLGGTTPTDGNTIYIDYDYYFLGHFTAVVVGGSGYLTTAQMEEVTYLVNSIKSPGTIATVNQATYTKINVTANITIDSSYDSSVVNNNAVDAIEAYITSLNVGEDVIISQIGKAITSIDGIIDMNTILIGGASTNYTITNTEKAVPNITTLTEV